MLSKLAVVKSDGTQTSWRKPSPLQRAQRRPRRPPNPPSQCPSPSPAGDRRTGGTTVTSDFDTGACRCTGTKGASAGMQMCTARRGIDVHTAKCARVLSVQGRVHRCAHCRVCTVLETGASRCTSLRCAPVLSVQKHRSTAVHSAVMH